MPSRDDRKFTKSSYVSWQIDILAKTIEHTERGVCRNNNRSISYRDTSNILTHTNKP